VARERQAEAVAESVSHALDFIRKARDARRAAAGAGSDDDDFRPRLTE
jgi:hypothetical protein